MDSFDLFRIDGHTLRVFATVCETGSVSRTAETFDLNQSTISHTLDKMRTAVGDPLFVKSGRGITPTEKALAILPRVQKILADIEGLVAPEKYDASLDARPFVIAIPTPALLDDMKSLYANLIARDPNVVLEIRRMAPSKDVAAFLSNDEADLAITVSVVRYPVTLNHGRYGSDTFAVFYDAACREPVRTVEDYSAARHAVVSFGGNNKSVVERALAEAGMKRKVSLVAPTASMLGGLVKGTDLIATMPRRLARSVYSDLAFSEPPLELPRLAYDLVWHRKYESSGRHSWLRDIILASRECVNEAGPTPSAARR